MSNMHWMQAAAAAAADDVVCITYMIYHAAGCMERCSGAGGMRRKRFDIFDDWRYGRWGIYVNMHLGAVTFDYGYFMAYSAFIVGIHYDKGECQRRVNGEQCA